MFISIIVFFIILSILVLIHELGHFLVAKKNNVFVEEFGFGLPPRIFGKKFGETIYSINWLPFGGFVKLLGEEQKELEGKKLPPEMKNRTFTSKTSLQKAAILVAGVTMNFLLGWITISILFTQGIPVPSDKVSVESVSPKSPAAVAGLQPKDEIQQVKLNDKTYNIKTIDDLISLAKKNGGEKFELMIKRNNGTVTKTLVPRKNPPAGQGPLGVALSTYEFKKYAWYKAPFYGLVESVVITKTIAHELLTTLFKFVTFQKVSADIAGPIGIVKVTNDAVQYGYQAVLQLLALLSFNLAIVNILPFPSLDGGRLAVVIYEVISRRKMNAAIENKMNLVGFMVLISLIVLISINDIVKLVIKH